MSPIFSFFLSEIFYLFYNHIRRSHFAKTGRIYGELIDDQCSYARLAQLALVLNEMFSLLLRYKGTKTMIYPSQALKKCPPKRLYPAYYEIIDRPIDLTMIRTKIDQGDYTSFDLFERDFFLLIDNAVVSATEASHCSMTISCRRTVEVVQTLLIPS
jgi:hypothetical protein